HGAAARRPRRGRKARDGGRVRVGGEGELARGGGGRVPEDGRDDDVDGARRVDGGDGGEGAVGVHRKRRGRDGAEENGGRVGEIGTADGDGRPARGGSGGEVQPGHAGGRRVVRELVRGGGGGRPAGRGDRDVHHAGRV